MELPAGWKTKEGAKTETVFYTVEDDGFGFKRYAPAFHRIINPSMKKKKMMMMTVRCQKTARRKSTEEVLWRYFLTGGAVPQFRSHRQVPHVRRRHWNPVTLLAANALKHPRIAQSQKGM